MAYSSEMREGISEFLGKPRSVDDIDWLAAIKNNLSGLAAIKSNLSSVLGGGSRDSESEDSDTSANRNTLFGG